MSKMTADEAIQYIWTCGHEQGGSPAGESPKSREAMVEAEAAIREAFAIADRARAELARLEAEVDGSIGVTRVIAELQRDMLKRIIGEGS